MKKAQNFSIFNVFLQYTQLPPVCLIFGSNPSWCSYEANNSDSNKVNYMTVGKNIFPFSGFSQSLIWQQTWADFSQKASSIVYMQIILCVNPLGFYDSFNQIWLGNLLAYLDPYLHCALWGWKCYLLLLVASQYSLQQRDTELFHCKPHPQQLLGMHFAYRHIITDQVRRKFYLF